MKTLYRIALCMVSVAVLTCCKKPGPEVEEGDNSFTFEGTEYVIRSVVRFDQDNNTTQFWLSEAEGLTTVDEVEESGDHVILSTHKSYIGSRDRFTKEGSFIRFGNSRYSTGDEGQGFIETAINEDKISISFAVETMRTKGEQPLALHGKYEGPFSIYQEEQLSNEIASDRDRELISEAVMKIREDGGVDTYVLYDNSGTALEFSLPQSYRGLSSVFTTSREDTDDINIRYGESFVMDMDAAYGNISTSVDEEGIKIAFDMSDGDVRIRAKYEGTYTAYTVKASRYIYDSGYPSSSPYDGRFFFEGLRIEDYNGVATFKFIPVDTDERFADIPELKISDSSLIGRENIDLRNTSGWHFEFDKIIADCYENEFKPAAAEGSFLTIIEEDGIYTVELVLAVEDPYLKYVSTIDLHYVGPVTAK